MSDKSFNSSHIEGKFEDTNQFNRLSRNRFSSVVFGLAFISTSNNCKNDICTVSHLTN